MACRPLRMEDLDNHKGASRFHEDHEDDRIKAARRDGHRHLDETRRGPRGRCCFGENCKGSVQAFSPETAPPRGRPCDAGPLVEVRLPVDRFVSLCLPPKSASVVSRGDGHPRERILTPHDEAITDLSPRLLQLRAGVERSTGRSFNAQAFHEFVLSQGLLPPTLMREAVMARFAGRK